ncbi:MAG: sigma-70 family RNA polymerase sigma factor, partial [Armatimonadetes bacterium]|nr:sigma-70 family RNA polymerase sigma factor [Armatimonadota bacterium]
MSAVVNNGNAAPFSPRAERDRLYTVCLRLTGNADAADDLAQETVLIGLRRVATNNAPRDWSPYLFGIARKLCAAWRARRGLDEAYTVSLEGEPALADFALADMTAPDPLATLLQDEREQLLDAALLMLKDTARQTLIARYVDGLPLREIAEQSGVSENAATVRVHRGLDALRNVLQTTLRPQAAAHGLLPAEAAQGWRETLLFCPRCGQNRLQGRFVPGAKFALRCPTCTGMLDG